MKSVTIIGGGLAGVEAAWQISRRGVPVELWEMRPQKLTPAHKTGYFAELVCSNSLKSVNLDNASGLLKAEMELLDSLIIKTAKKHRVPAGGALAVDRDNFAKEITAVLTEHNLISVKYIEAKNIPQRRPLIIASGPLTAGPLADAISQLTGEEYFSFYDAAAPIVTLASIDQDRVFRGSRYGKGDGDYINCPMTEEEYLAFFNGLMEAEQYPLHDFEQETFFEGCVPIEALGKRGFQTLLFGPLRPVGLDNPKTGERPYAVVQLRQDNKEGTLYNMVGFQTNLKWGEQNRVFRLIPGLEQAEFVRYGVMHRNSFINSPKLLKATTQLSSEEGIYFAGQLTGVEGYMESAASGLVAGINAAYEVLGKQKVVFPQETAIGALHYYITSAINDFQPMNINFGLFPPLSSRIRNKKQRNLAISQRSLENLTNFMLDNDI